MAAIGDEAAAALSNRLFEFGDSLRTNLMEDLTWFIDANAEPVQFFLADNTQRIIRLKTVLARTGLSRTTLYRKMGWAPSPPDQDQRPRRRLARVGAGDPYGNRTRVSAVKGPRPNR
jgi:hypothetical protein